MYKAVLLSLFLNPTLFHRFLHAYDINGAVSSDLDACHTFTLYNSNNDGFVEHANILRKIELFLVEKSLYDDDIVFNYKDDLGINSKCHPFSSCLLYTSPEKIDRTCLLNDMYPKRDLFVYKGDWNFYSVLDFVYSSLGFSFRSVPNLNVSTEIFRLNEASQLCDEIDMSIFTIRQFIFDYWIPQKPVILKNFVATNYKIVDLLSNYGHMKVGVKLSPSIEYEGIDKLSNWEKNSTQFVPNDVLRKLQSPELVVVRAAHMDMKIYDVLHLLQLQHKRRQTGGNCEGGGTCSNAYVEYTDMTHSNLKGLYDDLLRPSLGDTRNMYSAPSSNHSANGFDLHHRILGGEYALEGIPYLWLGDGNTVGKLHFDPFDNLLLQMEGSKNFFVIDPSQNERMLEGHMREAQLEVELVSDSPPNITSMEGIEDMSFKAKDGSKYSTRDVADLNEYLISPSRRDGQNSDRIRNSKFIYKKELLLESTSMVHSPLEANAIRASSDMPHMSCQVSAGDALWLPSYWWHEVTSSPGPTRHFSVEDEQKDSDAVKLNVAINFWYAPLYEKEFPCKECKKKINRKYFSVLKRMVQEGLL